MIADPPGVPSWLTQEWNRHIAQSAQFWCPACQVHPVLHEGDRCPCCTPSTFMGES